MTAAEHAKRAEDDLAKAGGAGLLGNKNQGRDKADQQLHATRAAAHASLALYYQRGGNDA